MSEWNGIGFVPFKMKDRIAAEYKAVTESLSVRPQRQRRGGAPAREQAGTPREKLMRQYEAKKAEIQTYENNVAMISSKSGNSFVDAINATIEQLKAEADDLMKQIRELPEE